MRLFESQITHFLKIVHELEPKIIHSEYLGLLASPSDITSGGILLPSEVLRDVFGDETCVVLAKLAILTSLISLELLIRLPKLINLALSVEDGIVVPVSLQDITFVK